MQKTNRRQDRRRSQAPRLVAPAILSPVIFAKGLQEFFALVFFEQFHYAAHLLGAGAIGHK
jgi:hypothetical protein